MECIFSISRFGCRFIWVGQCLAWTIMSRQPFIFSILSSISSSLAQNLVWSFIIILGNSIWTFHQSPKCVEDSTKHGIKLIGNLSILYFISIVIQIFSFTYFQTESHYNDDTSHSLLKLKCKPSTVVPLSLLFIWHQWINYTIYSFIYFQSR